VQPELTGAAVRKVLLIGSSLFTFSETDASESLPHLLEEELAGRLPGVSWHCQARVLFQGATSLRKLKEWLGEIEPDVVVFEVSSYQFVHRAVTLRVKNRWPRLYGPVAALMGGLKRAGGGSFDGGRSARGLIFRIPLLAAHRLVGGDAELSLHDSLDGFFAGLDEVRRREDISLICSMPKLQWREVYQAWAEAQVGAAKDEVAAYCLRHRLPTYDVEAELAKTGRRPGLAPDNIHYDRATSRFEASLIAARLVDALPAG
jgi:hypothetical protein